MTKALFYPPADRSTQWFAPGSVVMPMDHVKWLEHTTETAGGWPSYTYDGIRGGSAPTFTYEPWTHKWRQHFPVNQSSRALRNGDSFYTNRVDVVQVEISCYCDPSLYSKYGHAAVALDDQALDDLADFAIWLHQEWGMDLVLVDKPWPPYPQSLTGGRMTESEFINFSGICGHEHAPFNCVVPETLILNSSLDWVEAGSLKTGDSLVAFDETGSPIGNATNGRRFREAIATVNGRSIKRCYEVVMDDGRTIVASEDHKWLVNTANVNRGARILWIETKDLDPSVHKIKSIGKPWTYGATVGKTTTQESIKSVTYAGLREVVNLETTEKTYIANGLLCHNTHGDPGGINNTVIMQKINAKLDPGNGKWTAWTEWPGWLRIGYGTGIVSVGNLLVNASLAARGYSRGFGDTFSRVWTPTSVRVLHNFQVHHDLTAAGPNKASWDKLGLLPTNVPVFPDESQFKLGTLTDSSLKFQAALICQGYGSVLALQATRLWRPRCVAAVQSLQSNNGLTATGVVDEATWTLAFTEGTK